MAALKPAGASAVTEDSAQVLLSEPLDKARCDEERVKLNRMLGRTAPLQREKLDKMKDAVARSTFEFTSALAQVASDCVDEVRTARCALAELNKLVTKDQTLNQAIKRGWKAVRDAELATLDEETKDKKAFLSRLQDEISSKKVSEVLIQVHEDIIEKKKTSGLGPMEWKFLGGGWAEETYKYTCVYPIRDVKVDVSDGSFKKVKQSTNEIELYIRSNNGFSLVAIVRIFVYEKDHRNTHDWISRKEKEIEGVKKDLEDFAVRKRDLVSCQNGDQLNEVMVKGLAEGRANFRKSVQALVSQPSSSDGTTTHPRPPSKSEVAFGLDKLLNLMEQRGLMSKSISPLEKQTIKEFMSEYTELKKMREAPTFQAVLTQEDLKSDIFANFIPTGQKQKRDVDRIVGTKDKLMNAANIFGKGLQGTSSFCRSVMENEKYRYQIAIAVIVFALAAMFASLMPSLLLAFGVAILVQAARETVFEERRALNKVMKELNEHAGKLATASAEEAGKIIKEINSEWAQRISVDYQHRVNVDKKIEQTTHKSDNTQKTFNFDLGQFLGAVAAPLAALLKWAIFGKPG